MLTLGFAPAIAAKVRAAEIKLPRVSARSGTAAMTAREASTDDRDHFLWRCAMPNDDWGGCMGEMAKVIRFEITRVLELDFVSYGG